MTIISKLFENSREKLTIFLPSVRSNKIFPYYPRINWSDFFSDEFDILYVADSNQNDDFFLEPGGSWFFNRDGTSNIYQIADYIREISSRKQYREIILYGSSMGGYAALVLGSIIPDVVVVAECPQIFLRLHPGSLYVINNVNIADDYLLDLTEIIENKMIAKEVNFVCNSSDHHFSAHLLPLIKMPPSEKRRRFFIYSDRTYPNGHSALRLEDASKIIRSY
ncbi:MAG: alpha/beta hydrolase [Pseudomonadota bacterium]|nr:alpha/beta hydrolase [Pseudomonadota bacterium]